MQLITTGILGSRDIVRNAVANQIAVFWSFENGYAAVSPNGTGGVATVAIYDSANAAKLLSLFVAQYPTGIHVIGNAGFSAAYGSYGTSDYADDRAQAAAIAAATTQPRTIAGIPIS